VNEDAAMTVIPFPSQHSSGYGNSDISNERDDLIHEPSTIHIHADHTRVRDDFEATVTEAEWKHDARHLGTNALKRKYPLTFSAFNNLSGRVKTVGAVIDPEFRTFKSFLGYMGPRRSKELTLDRIDNSNPRYGPGLCEWKDKKSQARNRRSTILLTHPETGDKVPLMALAEERGVPPSRLRRQRADGWTDEEIFAGKRLARESATVAPGDRWPWHLQADERKVWETRYNQFRRLISPRAYEFRYEFAVRWMRETTLLNSQRITELWEVYGSPGDEGSPAADGRDEMPPNVRDEYDRRTKNQQTLNQSLSEALAGEAAWSAGVSEHIRPRRSPKNVDDD
jgi:hypothetical protein